MNSLPKRPKNGPHDRENAFRLHYFPEIPADFSVRKRSQPKGESAFNRIGFENANETLSGLDDDSLAGDKNCPADSNQKIEEIEAQAYLRGFNKGEKAGFKTGQEKIESVFKNLQNVVSEVMKLRKQIFIDSEREIVELALAIARRIICHEVTLNKTTVIDVTQEALKRVEDHEKIKIRMKPEDLECFENADSNPICNNENVTFEAEETISSGGCVIETDGGAFDARIEKQLQAVEGALRAAYKQYEQKN
jgi:flagellar biosynthesis/type III secretory pathway protein FliH